jgi:murein DD-endopeptidase MepM/ murein hydrolase activator NlpD
MARPGRRRSRRGRGTRLAALRALTRRFGTDRRFAPALILVALVAAASFGLLPSAAATVVAPYDPPGPAIAALRAAPSNETSAAPATASSSSAAAPALTSPAERPTAPPAKAAFADDGTLLKPLSVTSGPSPFPLAVYTVSPGDTLTGIADRLGLSMMTLWWANQLASKDQLHIGQRLVVPPVDGVLYHAAEGDTVTSVATRFHADPLAVEAYNDLAGDELTLGQQVMVPNGVGPSIVEVAARTAPAKPTAAKPAARPAATTSATGCLGCGFAPLLWPVRGGYVSQGFGCTGFWAEPPFGSCPHFHGGIDIVAPAGTSIRAAAAGTVIFAGWKSNGGGYQVWVSDGNNYYTGYHHMSVVLVHAGQRIGRGQVIGRVGMTGNATGPHLHFEVWIGPIWAGGYRVNPNAYF